MEAGLFSKLAVRTSFSMGFVKSYNPSNDLYRIGLDGKSEAVARPITSGVYKPYPPGTRVACIRFATSGWLIMGEVAFSKPPTRERESPSDAIYQKDLDLRGAIQDRYSIDMANFGDSEIDPLLEGDAIVANREDPRSYVRVYDNGDILSLASNFCFRLLNRVKNLAITWAKDCWAVFAGCSVKVETDDQTKKSTTNVSINSDPTDEADRDLDAAVGAISNTNRPTKNVSAESKGRTIEEGLWSLFGTHMLLEVDNKVKELRLSKVKIQSGTDTFGKTAQFRMNEDQMGLVWGSNKVTLNDDLTSLERGSHSIVMDDSRIALTWSEDKYIVLTDKGIQISGMLELVGGQLKLSSEAGLTSTVLVDGESVTVPSGTDGRPNLTYQVSGNKIDIGGSGEVDVINLNTDFSVRNFGLLDERFLTKYDTDMLAVKQHTHQVAITGTAPPQALPSQELGQTLDLPQAASSSGTLTSKTQS